MTKENKEAIVNLSKINNAVLDRTAKEYKEIIDQINKTNNQ